MAEALQWYPQDYCDETIPDPRADAQSWVERHDDGWRIAPFDTADPESLTIGALTDGQIVQFAHFKQMGSGRLMVFAEDAWAIDPATPADVNHIWAPADDFCADNPADLVTQLKDMGCFNEGEIHDLRFGQWTFDLAYRFDAATGTLTPVSTATA